MVCKEDVVTWFQRLNAHKRVDVMCSLIEMCLPLEVRFFGTCLEDIGKRDFHDLRDAEIKANDSSGHSDMQCLREKRTQRLLVIIVSLLRSCNLKCSNSLHRILEKLDFNEIIRIIDNTPADENPLDELLLLYTLALNHPAFTFEQKSVYADILVLLQEEDIKLQSTKTMNMGLVYHNSPLQPCNPCPQLAEDQSQLDSSSLGHCIANLAAPTSAQQVQDLSHNRSTVSAHPGLPLPTEQLPPTNYVHVTYTSPSHQPVSSLPWQAPVIISSLCAEPQGVEPTYPSAPLLSRPPSPCRSTSPSRPGSPQPSTEPVVYAYSKSSRQTDRLGSIDTTVAPPPIATVTCSAVDVIDPLQETIEKEMPNYLSNLQNHTIEEVKQMSDDELNGLGLPKGAITQLRSIVTKLQNTNGICNLDKHDLNTGVRRKQDNRTTITEAPHRRNQPNTSPSGYVQRTYPVLPTEGNPILFPPPALMSAPPGGPCYTCIAVPSPSRYQPHQFYCVSHNLRNLRLDADAGRNQSNSSSSTSNSSSASHSPPETPSFTSAPPQWDKGFSAREPLPGGTERSSPGCDDRLEKKAAEGGSEAMPALEPAALSQPIIVGNNSRPRMPGGLGRSRANPPGLQTMPVSRGRGLKPVTVILEGNQKVLPSCRRDGPMMNGVMPRTSHPPPMLPQYTSVNTTSQPPPYAGASRPDNVPYATAAFLQQSQFHPMRSTSSIFHSFPPGSYIRPTFPFPPNGEMVYQQYHPPPPTTYLPVHTYSAGFPPPKVSCYNCGKNHHANECKDSTMEEVANPVQYHLDYVPYQKPGECLSDK